MLFVFFVKNDKKVNTPTLLYAPSSHMNGEQIEVGNLFGGHRKPERRSRPRMPLFLGEERLPCAYIKVALSKVKSKCLYT